MNKPRVIAIVGPTSSGKTTLGIYLAQKLGGEVISADSRQVYKGLDIGTGKVTKKEMAGVRHHLLDVASPKRAFTASDFKKLGERTITMIYHSGKIPLVVGGTGLYADVLLGRILLPEVPPNKKLREQLERQTTKQLLFTLQKLDPERAQTIEPEHRRRLIRAIEIAKALGKNPSKASAMSGLPASEVPYEVLWLGLNPGEAVLNKKIIKRLHERFKSGMLREAKQLHAKWLSYKRMEELGLEYRSMARHLRGDITKEQMVEELERAIPHYAKRQNRWFKRNPNIVWVSSKTEALRVAKNFLK